MMKNYNDTVQYMFSLLPMYQRQGRSAFKKTLDNIYALLADLDNPHEKMRCIHVAGTNGKGSTSHFLASILQEQGLRVGLYTSPHYQDFRERIKINGEFIGRQEVVNFIEKIEESIKAIRPSFFEITVALAFDYFAKQKPDIVIVETGLGGRLDSTNVVHPILSIITNIGWDHQNMLGNTLPLIAGEKAGIIKNQVPVLIGEYQQELMSVFSSKAASVNSDLRYAQELIKSDDSSIEFEKSIKLDISDQISYQKKNIKTAVAAAKLLSASDLLKIDYKSIEAGIRNVVKNTYFIGRWMSLSDRRMIFADSAHNQDGLKALFDHIATLDFGKLHVVCGFVNDKKIDDVITFFPPSAKYYFAKANIPRGLDCITLKNRFSEYGRSGKSYISVRKAFAASRATAKSNDLILVCGSIFVVAEVL